MIQDRICRSCNCIFKGGPRAYWCPECRYERHKVRHRIDNEKRRLGTTRKLGSLDKCEMCGKDYIVNSGLQRFCPDCKNRHAMEYDRETSIKYYHNHKENINPIRYARRRKSIEICRACGKEFNPNGKPTVYCSKECKRQLYNKIWMQRYYSKRLKK